MKSSRSSKFCSSFVPFFFQEPAARSQDLYCLTHVLLLSGKFSQLQAAGITLNFQVLFLKLFRGKC